MPFEKWHETTDTAFIYLHKALSMPVRFTVSPHFYYQAAQWPCKNAINMLVNNEHADRSYHDLLVFTTRNKNEFEIIFCTMSMPASLSESGDSKVCRDYKISKHCLA
jgi:hypothetical protein